MPEIFKLFLSKRPIDCGRNEGSGVSQPTASAARAVLHGMSLLGEQRRHKATDQLGTGRPEQYDTLPGPVPTTPSPAPRGSRDPIQGPRTCKAQRPEATLSPLGHPSS